MMGIAIVGAECPQGAYAVWTGMVITASPPVLLIAPIQVVGVVVFAFWILKFVHVAVPS